MPPAPPKPAMSLGELAICEDFLDSHREYAIDLFSNVERLRQWHGTDTCLETRESGTCTVCELCSADGLLGATKKALGSYNDAEKHLQEARTSFGKNVPHRGASNRQTWFKSNLAKTVFLCIVTVGDTLRSQHATWQARLQNELVTPPLSAQSPHHIDTGPGDLDKNRVGDVLLPTYLDSRFVSPEINPKLAAVPTGWVPETTSSSSTSTFVVFRRCLSSDCPCEANRASAASNTSLGGPSLLDSKKTRTSKATAKPEAATRGNGTRSTTTNLECRSKGTSDTSGALAKTRTNAQTQKASTYDDLNNLVARAFDTQRPQDVMLGEYAPSDSDPRSGTHLLTDETEASSSPAPELIVDPRVFRLRARIVRSDDARRALIEWCRTWTVDLQLDPRERHRIGSEASLTHESTLKDARGYPSALARGLDTVESGKSISMTGHVGEAATNGPSHSGDETTAQEQRFNSEQEEFKRRWLTARNKRCKDRKRRPALV